MSSDLLDEIAAAPPHAIDKVVQALGDGFGGRVGPIVEYELYRRGSRQDLPELGRCAKLPIVARIAALIEGRFGAAADLSLQPKEADAIAVPAELGAAPAWIAFVKRADATARAAGFPDSIAAGLAGALRELADNIVQHSESSNPGIAAFCQNDTVFEYVVADTGIGMLASLQRVNEFRSLRDDLEALPLAVTSGVSRRGRGTGYGYGYRAVFLPLRAASGAVRLRSGRAVLQMTGLGLSPDQGVCSQRPHYQGVAVNVRLSTKSDPTA